MALNYITFDKEKYHLHLEMQEWCKQQFGEGKWISYPYPKDWTSMPDWTIHSMFGNTTFAFKDEKQYNWFILRWAD
jgi:hypothetical protein